MSNIVNECLISLSNIEFRMSQHFRVDGDIFEKLLVWNRIFLNTDKMMHFPNIRIRVDVDFGSTENGRLSRDQKLLHEVVARFRTEHYL